MSAPLLEFGLPQNIDAERFILGSVLIDSQRMTETRGVVRAQDFALEKHRRIFGRMCEIDDRGQNLDRVTLAEELMRTGELEAVDGLTYLVSLDTGMPRVPAIEGYLRIVRDKSTLRETIVILQNLLNQCLTAGDDATEILARADKMLAALRNDSGNPSRWMTPEQIIQEHPGGLEGLVTPSTSGAGIPYPWLRLQEKTAGMQKGQMIVLAARPGVGKSSAALQISYHAALNGSLPAYISLEMDKGALVNRMISQLSYVDSEKMRGGYLNRDERGKISRAANLLVQYPIHIDDKRNQTCESIRQSLKRLVAQASVPIGPIIIDHFHLVRGSKGQEIRERYSDIADAMQGWGKEFDSPVVALAQLSRECEKENRPPGLIDLKETGKLEENADVVAFLHRPETYAKYRDRQDLHGLGEILLAKQRQGPIAKIGLVWMATCQRFDSRAEDLPEESGYEERERA